MPIENPSLVTTDLDPYLAKFASAFDDPAQLELAGLYIRGLLTELERKSTASIAQHVGLPPRTLQSFLSAAAWDHDRVRAQTMNLYSELLGDQHATAVLAASVQPRRGCVVPGTSLQDCWTGSTPPYKRVNGITLVDLLASGPSSYYVPDTGLYLPRSWTDDPAKRRGANIHESVEYRPTWRIGLDMFQFARQHGMNFDLLAANREFGSDPSFFAELDALGQPYLVNLDPFLLGWPESDRDLEVHDRAQNFETNCPPRPLDTVAHHEPDERWWCHRYRGLYGEEQRSFSVTMLARLANKDGSPGPVVRTFGIRNDALSEPLTLFVTNAKDPLPKNRLLKAARMLEAYTASIKCEADQVGRTAYSGKSHLGIQRHLALANAARLFRPPVPTQPGGRPPISRQRRDTVLELLGFTYGGIEPADPLIWIDTDGSLPRSARSTRSVRSIRR